MEREKKASFSEKKSDVHFALQTPNHEKSAIRVGVSGIHIVFTGI
jgi:hypothetical protein